MLFPQETSGARIRHHKVREARYEAGCEHYEETCASQHSGCKCMCDICRDLRTRIPVECRLPDTDSGHGSPSDPTSA